MSRHKRKRILGDVLTVVAVVIAGTIAFLVLLVALNSLAGGGVF
jgi:hypothetical protein